jgi:hypothetical protein
MALLIIFVLSLVPTDLIFRASARGIRLKGREVESIDVMFTNTKIALAAALIAALATPVFALEYGEWTVDSGRYVNGQVPSYLMHKASNAEDPARRP